MYLGRTRSVALSGLEGTMVEVEVHVSDGLPHVAVTGLPDKACGQAPDRIRSAAAVTGHPIPTRRITINLSPASIPKVGTVFDLPMAVALLRASGVVTNRDADDTVHLGELALDGRIRPVRGVLPAVLEASRCGVTAVVVPEPNLAEAQLVEGVRVHAAPDLATLVGWYAAGPLPLAPPAPSPGGPPPRGRDLAEVVGQHEARLALELAAVGGHHILLSGPPGVGKTMLAERLVTLLPPLTRDQALQTHAIRSLAGVAIQGGGLDRTPPFVAPHHSASTAAIVGGGGGQVLPGAISQAHHGVLFLDEAPEFGQAVLQTLRQPLESGQVVIARARQVVRYPAHFLLVLAANPCPCGRGWGKALECTCQPREIRSYASRLSGPLLDRVDIQVTVPPVLRAAFADEHPEPSAVVAERVARAREAQRERWASLGHVTNGEIPGHVMRRAPWRLPRAATGSLDRGLDAGLITLRGYDRVLRLAWSISDLAGSPSPGREEVELALGLRTRGRSAA